MTMIYLVVIVVYFSGLAASPSFFFKALETLKLTVVAPSILNGNLYGDQNVIYIWASGGVYTL